MPVPTAPRTHDTSTHRHRGVRRCARSILAVVLACSLALGAVAPVGAADARAPQQGRSGAAEVVPPGLRAEPLYETGPGVSAGDDPATAADRPAPRRIQSPPEHAPTTAPAPAPSEPWVGARTLGQPNAFLHDPLTGLHLVFVDGRLRAFDDEGRQVAARDIGLPFGQLVLDGDLFVQGPRSVVEVDRRTLAPMAEYPLEGRPHLVGDELWALVWDRWTVVDRTTGAVRTVPGTLVTSTSHVPAFGSRILLSTNSGLSMVDVGTDPPSIVADLPGSGLWSVARDGTVLTSEAPGVFTRRGPDLSVIDSTPVPGAQVPDFVMWAEDVGLLVTSTDGQLALRRPGSGEVVVSMPRPDSGGEVVAVLPDGSLVLVDAGGIARRMPFAPTIDRTSAAVFRPEWASTLTVHGAALDAVTAARVGGIVVPHRTRIAGSIELDVSGVTGDGPAEIVLTSPFGEGRLTVPAQLPRGNSVLTIGSTSLGAPDAPTRWLVRCGQWRSRGSQLPGTVDVVAVPSLEECTVTFSAGPVAGIRSGRVQVDEPADPMVPLFGHRIPFSSGAPVHVGAIVRDPVGTRVIGLLVTDLGAPPPAAARRFTIRCGEWSTEVTLSGRGEAAVDVPSTVPDAARCSAVAVRTGGATRTVVAVLAEDVTPRFEERRRLRFRLDAAVGNAYLFFAFDHGGSDLEAPIVVGEPGAAVRGREGAGAVRIVRTLAGGVPDPSSTAWLVQRDRAGRPGRGDRFGAAVTLGDFDDDGWLDLAVGAPGESVGARRGAGVVQVFAGSARGFSAQRVTTLDRRNAGAGPPRRSDGFGSALAVVDFDGDGVDDLAVGAPGVRVGRAAAAGEVFVFGGTSAGLGRRATHRFTQADTPRERPERGDRFGAALAGARGFLVVGAPGERLGSAREAGIVHRIDGLSLEMATLRTRSSSGDGHGTAVDVDRDGRVLVGAPGRERSGAVVLHVRSGQGWKQWVVTQSELASRAAPGVNRFGAAVAFVGDPDDVEVFVGAPGTDVGGVVDAGFVHLIRPLRPRPERGWVSASFVGLDRVSPPATEFGSTLSVGRLGQVIVGSPGGGPRGSGAVATYAGRWLLLHDGLPGWGATRRGDALGAAVAG